jgi:RNA polymerase sigma-70 factor (ECF subfamily)
VSAVDHSQSSRRSEFALPDLGESTTKSAIAGQKWPMSFTTTHWSVILDAQTESPTAQEALEKLCQIYWHPIYSFVQRKGANPEEAKDITQEFFADLLEHRSLTAVSLVTFHRRAVTKKTSNPWTRRRLIQRSCVRLA